MDGWVFSFLDKGYAELNPITCGYERCEAGHTAFGHRNYYLLHYVEKGQGILYSPRGTYTVTKGQAFLIYPHENARYVADEDNPWTYVWIGFDGSLGHKLETLPSPVMELPYTAFSMIRALEKRTDTREEMASAILFMIFADSMAGKSVHPHYVRRATDAVNSLYMTPLTVGGLANSLGIDRRYLSRIFKAEKGMSVQEYLIHVRMEQACRLLRQHYTVGLTAELVGYTDVFNFSKMFKKRYGVSPQMYVHEKPQKS